MILKCTWFIFVCVFLTGVNVGHCDQLKIATYNTSLYRNNPGQLQKELQAGLSNHARNIAEVIQRVRPQIILLNEFDFDPTGKSIQLFKEKYLQQSQNGAKPIEFKFHFAAPVNTGIPSRHDLDNDGRADGPGDAYGFGKFPGQYGMLVLSQFPIERGSVRTFQKFKWKDMPGALLPMNKDGTSFYTAAELNEFRLSSKSHWDVAIQVRDRPLHFLVSHPTPPVFDKEEDRNGRRNHDEIRFWNDYVTPSKSSYIYDDAEKTGGLKSDVFFVIAGDQNADPHDGDSTGSPIRLLLQNKQINSKQTPRSLGAVEASKKGVANQKHKGEAGFDTGDFNDRSVGNLRIDYVLPSANLSIKNSGVFWPVKADPHSRLIAVSDHRLVWVNVEFPKR
ncbi:endonuclease/exonuclease/phosphatase family protein [bacterium]|jgi:hypothetical protein|nr:endonuclease/exonuclease/phosphatase family protein [bacterium]